jgi:RNA polymerase sigma-70 factor (ECF subfamily)
MAIASDEGLYARVRQGDLSAFDQLYARYERRLFGFLLRVLGNRSDAEEVFHDVLLKVMTGPEAHFADARFVSYIFRMARNACANRQRHHLRGELALSRYPAPETSPENPEERLAEEERTTSLARAAEQLPPALAEVFGLRSSGLSYGEIAEALEIPLGTVKSRMNALVIHLKGELVP